MSDFATADGPESIPSGKGYSVVLDQHLPFDVVHEHKTPVIHDGEQKMLCAAKRKWVSATTRP